MKRSVKTKRVLAAVLSSVFAVPAVSDAGIFDDNLAYAETSMTAISTRQNDELAEENGWKMSPDGKFYFFVLDDGTVQISMWCEDTSEITVPETFEYEDETYTVTGIGKEAFGGFNKTLKKITLPETLEHIGESAFYDCRRLEEINFPDKLFRIQDSAFGNCQNLESVNFGSELKEIWNYAFRNCKKLKEVYIPAAVSIVGADAFEDDTEIKIAPENIFLKLENGRFIGRNSNELTRGDINCDGVIDISDVTLLSLYLIGERELYGNQLTVADVNVNKNVDLTDLAVMKQFVSKKINSFAEVDTYLSDEDVSEILPENAEPYAYSEDIKNSDVSVYKLDDGTLKVLFLNGRFTMELPEVWEGHFVIDDRWFCSKLPYNGSGSGKLFTCIPQNISRLSSEGAFGAPYMVQIRGISGEMVLHTTRVSDMTYDYDNEEYRNEYEMLRKTLPDVYKTIRSYSDKTGKMEAVFDLPEYDCFTGTVSDFHYDEDEAVYAYDEDYALDQNEQEDEHRLCEMDTDTNVVARRAVCLGEVMFYDCYDQNDGTHYGWIRADAILFNSEAGK